MTRRLSAVLSALALVLAVAGPAGDASARSRRRACYQKGSVTVLKTRAVRVFNQDDAVYGCLLSVGRARYLDSDDGVYSSVSPIRVAGRFVAWGYDEIPACKADCPPGTTAINRLGVVDLRSGRGKTTGARPAALVVTRFGAVAWIEGSAGDYAVMAWDAGGERVLDRGAIAMSPFRLSGASVLWRNGPVGRWEELRRR